MWWKILAGAVVGAAAAIGAIFVIELALSTIMGWFNRNTTIDSSYGELIKKKMQSGDYKVIAGVFDNRGVETVSNEWEAEKLDEDLEEYFGGRSKVRVEL